MTRTITSDFLCTSKLNVPDHEEAEGISKTIRSSFLGMCTRRAEVATADL